MSRPLTARMLAFQVAGAILLLIGVMSVCCLVGTQKACLGQAFRGPSPSGPPNLDYEILVGVRLPRVILAACIGMALGASGAVLQALLRNSLADPYVLGISSGAALGAVLALIGGIGWSAASGCPTALFAFVGAMGTVWLVWGIGRAAGRGNVASLLLAGVVVNAFLSAAILFLISIAAGNELYATIFWLMGNLNAAALQDPRVVAGAAVLISLGVFVLFLLAAPLNILSFGDTDAHSVGVHVAAVRRIAFGVAALITAVAVSLGGLIGFVGLIAPHTVRLVSGADHRRLVPLSALVGGMFLVIADTFARIVVAPAELPVGVITALLGGPFFLAVLVRYAREGTAGP